MAGIPIAHDAKLASIDQQMRSISGQLVTLHWANPKDRDRLKRVLRERVQDLVSDIWNCAESD